MNAFCGDIQQALAEVKKEQSDNALPKTKERIEKFLGALQQKFKIEKNALNTEDKNLVNEVIVKTHFFLQILTNLERGDPHHPLTQYNFDFQSYELDRVMFPGTSNRNELDFSIVKLTCCWNMLERMIESFYHPVDKRSLMTKVMSRLAHQLYRMAR